MDVVQCIFVCRRSPRFRTIRFDFMRRSFQPSSVPYGVYFRDRNLRRYSATCGLKAQRSSTLVDALRRTLLLPGERISRSSGECCCVLFPACWRSAGKPGNPVGPPINRIENKTMSNGEQEAGRGSKSVCGQRSVTTFIRAGLPGWTWRPSRKVRCVCRSRRVF